jgi:hypothetical protein
VLTAVATDADLLLQAIPAAAVIPKSASMSRYGNANGATARRERLNRWCC